jgi:hypothetical protein
MWRGERRRHRQCIVRIRSSANSFTGAFCNAKSNTDSPTTGSAGIADSAS